MNKRLRFEILRRDGYRCTYCGAPARDSELEVDHVIPRSRGGSDDPANLVTACKDCNAGKTDLPAGAELPPPVMRVSAMPAKHLQAALLTALTGPVGCRLTYCPTCKQFCTIGSGCESLVCYSLHDAFEVVP